MFFWPICKIPGVYDRLSEDGPISYSREICEDPDDRGVLVQTMVNNVFSSTSSSVGLIYVQP